jgi:hypothetical protein
MLSGESGVGKGRQRDLGLAGHPLRGDGRDGQALQRPGRGQRHGQRPLVEQAGNLRIGLDREGGCAVERGIAAERDAGGAGAPAVDPVAAAVAVQAGDQVGDGQRFAPAQRGNGDFVGSDRQRQAQVGRQSDWRAVRLLGDVQLLDAQRGDLQRAVQQRGRRPVDMQAADLDLLRRVRPAHPAEAESTEQAAAGGVDLQAPATGAFGQTGQRAQAAFAARQPAGGADQRDGGKNCEAAHQNGMASEKCRCTSWLRWP